MPEPTVVDASVVDAPIYLEAFERKKAAIRAVPNDTLLLVNIEPLLAIQAMQKALPRLKVLRPRLIEEFKSFDPADLDNLQDYGHAFAHATTLLRAAEPQVSGFDGLVEECGELLGKLDAYLRAAIEAGVINTSRLSELKRSVGHRNLVHDLLLLAQIYRANWSKIEGKTFFTQADIRHADALAARLNSALAERESKPGAFDEVSVDRQKAYTLFYKAYTRVRRRVQLLLEEDGDAHLLDEVMPSLHNNRVGRKRGEDTDSAPTPPAPVAGSNNPPPPPAARVGMPDSDPFTAS